MKKILCILLTLSMLFVGTAVGADPLYADVNGSAPYIEAIETLNVLGIMIGDENGNFNPEASITRAETAAVVTRLKGIDNAISVVNGTKFADVAANHWAAGYINLAEQSGIINGYGDGNFGPEDEVTYEQVIKMIVAALGRTPEASAKGGYPSGYMIVAAQENITKGVNVISNASAARKDVARLVFNALEVNTMEQTSYKKGEEEYQVVDKTLLKDYLKVNKYEGVITDTYLTTGSDVKDNFIKITLAKLNNDTSAAGEIVSFVEGNTNASALFGYYVSAYGVEDNETGDLILLGATKKINKNNVLTISYSQIENIASNIISYFADNSDVFATDIEIAENALHYLNGKKVDNILDEIDFGQLTLIDNNADEKYDVVILMKETANYIVKEINPFSKALIAKDGSNIDIDIENETSIIKFYNADGSAASFDDIKADDVLTVYENGNLKTVYICSDKIAGVIAEEIPDVDGNNAYVINGKEYYIAYNTPIVLAVGDGGTFYLNAGGYIVDKNATAAAGDKYAYLYKTYIANSIDGKTVELKYLTSAGKWETNILANKITVVTDGVPATVTVNEISDTSFITSNNPLFQYTTNSNGEINKLYFVKELANHDEYLSIDRTVTNREYNASQKKLGSLYFNDNIKVFSVAENVIDEDDIVLTTADSLFVDGTIYNNVTAYDIQNEVPGILVAVGASADIIPNTDLLVITKISDVNNSNGNIVKKIYGYQAGKEVTNETTEDFVITDRTAENISTIAVGDTVIFSTDASGAINKIQVLMSLAEAKSIISANDGAFVENGSEDSTVDMFGFVAKKANSRMYLNNGFGTEVALVDTNGDNASISMIGANVNVYEVNVSRDTVQPFSFGEVDAENRSGKESHWAYIRLYDDAVVDVVVYKTVNP